MFLLQRLHLADTIEKFILPAFPKKKSKINTKQPTKYIFTGIKIRSKSSKKSSKMLFRNAGRQPLKIWSNVICLNRSYQFKSFKACLRQILLGLCSLLKYLKTWKVDLKVLLNLKMYFSWYLKPDIYYVSINLKTPQEGTFW